MLGLSPSKMTTEQTVSGIDSHSNTFEKLESYPWDEDADFQSGLAAILGPNPSPEQATELTLRARCFYYSR